MVWADRRTGRPRVRAGTVISARDEIWIDMVQFDVGVADRLWEGSAPAQGAPGWYDDVSGLIETAHGPAEPRELVDEPIVVEDMQRTTLGRPRRHSRDRRTVGRMIAMKVVAATTASVLGVAAAAAATTGIVATVAGMVVPMIEARVFPADDGDERRSGGPDSGIDDRLMTIAQASPATATPVTSPQATDGGPAAGVTPTRTAAAVEAVDGDPAEPVEPVASSATPTDPVEASPEPATPTDPLEAVPPEPSSEPEHPARSPSADAPPAAVGSPPDTPASPHADDAGSRRAHGGGRPAQRDDVSAGPVRRPDRPQRAG
jgi:hypothetical protein